MDELNTAKFSSGMPAAKDEKAVLRCEVKEILERFKKGEIEVVERSAAQNRPEENPYANYALVSTQRFDENNKLIVTTLEVNSPHLLEAFKAVIKYYPGVQLDFMHKVVIEDPYMFLVHHRGELEQYRGETSNATTRMHLSLLLDRLDAEICSPNIKGMIAAGLITFPLVWMLFKPGDLIYETRYGHARLYSMYTQGYGENSQGKYFEAEFRYVSFDGTEAGVATTKLRLYEKYEFHSSLGRQITALSFFPLKFLDKVASESVLDAMMERGIRYLKIEDQCIMQYDGVYMYLKRPPWDYYNENASYDGTFLPETMSGRVVIDPKTFGEEAKAKKEEVESSESSESSDTSSVDNDGDNGNKETLLHIIDKTSDGRRKLNPQLCPPYVYGFATQKKEWARFFIDTLKPVIWQENPLDSLILPLPQKRLLRALADNHKFPGAARDTIQLKGKGLVILLHGVPGAGKTLTAETTAEHTHRLLFTISTGELGSYETRIEYELNRLLTYASTFQAIVLIDEADVFLESRQSGVALQVQQNAMVAVFLRQLEYFQGIIFLTSNRVSSFDSAIKSRIHLALQYHKPDASIRRMLWKKHLEIVPTEEKELDLEETLNTVQIVEMNGREISNSISTAKSEGSKLKLEHLQTIIQVWGEFQESLK